MKQLHLPQLIWNNFRLLIMPQLSPSMTTGILKKLYIHPGKQVSSYDLVFDITTKTLLNIPSKDAIEMQIEVLEDMYVAKLFEAEGSMVEIGKPIALLCDSINELDQAKDFQVCVSGIYND